MDDKIYITYLKFNNESSDDLIKKIDLDIINKEKKVVFTPNLDFLRLAYKNIEFRKYLNESDYSLIDGKPLVWLAKLERKKVKKLSGSDFAIPIFELANEKGYSILFFGGKEGIAEKACDNLKNKYPNVGNLYSYSPIFGYEKDEDESIKCVEFINSCNADIVLLCTGAPKTELFYSKYKDMLNKSVYLSIGATVDFVAGNIKRAPKWMSEIGLEWMYRLFKDFRRLFKRYWLDFWFLIKIFFICIFRKKKIENRKV